MWVDMKKPYKTLTGIKIPTLDAAITFSTVEILTLHRSEGRRNNVPD